PNFEKISDASSSKEAWDTLEKSYAGGLKVKKVRLQMMRRQYELLQIEEQEIIAEYFNRIRSLTNLMKGYGDKLDEQSIVDKVLRTLAKRFDTVKKILGHLDKLKKDDKKTECNSSTRKHIANSSSATGSKNYSKNSYANSGFNGKKKKDKSKIQCYNCKEWSHFASECKLKRKGIEAEARLAKDENSEEEEVLLMADSKVFSDGNDVSDGALMVIS
ncbi:hypothetical protein Lal_00024783, partial [Lupinus albus]